MPRIKTCLHCGQPFFGRRDAKTCSMRCRKGLQRSRDFLASETNQRGGLGYNQNSASSSRGTSVVGRPVSARRVKAGKHLKHLLVILVCGLSLSFAALGHSAHAAVSQGYVTDDKDLRQYMAVSLTGNNLNGYPVVQSSSINQSGMAIGIAVGLHDSLLAVAPASSQVYVVSQGTTKVYVSDLNGTPNKGDNLVLSPLRGILMKADKNSDKVVGSALKTFSLSASQIVKAQDSSGKTVDTHVGLIEINLAVGQPAKTEITPANNWLTSFGTSLTGQQISGLRILSALAIFFTLMVVEGEIIYSTVSTSITAMGRNPLARKSITKQSMHSAAIASVILAAGIGVIAMLVWL